MFFFFHFYDSTLLAKCDIHLKLMLHLVSGKWHGACATVSTPDVSFYRHIKLNNNNNKKREKFATNVGSNEIVKKLAICASVGDKNAFLIFFNFYVIALGAFVSFVIISWNSQNIAMHVLRSIHTHNYIDCLLIFRFNQ